MSSSSKYVIIEGQFSSGVLGTFRIIRGFALLKDLALISEPYFLSAPTAGTEPVQGFQRQIDDEHAAGIKRYLQDGNLRFIPEVILSIRADCREELDDQHFPIGIISDTTPGLQIKRRWKSKNIPTHQIIIERENLELLRTQKRIRRIDGNHRLHLANELTDNPAAPTKYLAPFCVILLGPPGDGNDDYVESMLFHTINSTALPLDSEHALQLVLGQGQEYRPAADIEFADSVPLYMTRVIKNKVDHLPETQRQRLGPTPATVLHAAVKSIIETNSGLLQNRQTVDSYAEEMCGALADILARLPAINPDFCKSDFFIELATLVWGETPQEANRDDRINQAVKTLESIGQWLGHDGFHQIQAKSSLGKQIFEIFCTVRNRIPKRIFLSRWYPKEDDGNEKHKADLRKDMINRTLTDLKTEGINLALDDPGTETGATVLIHPKMYEAIANNDIILIDLSGVRPNVCVEAGYALERHKSNRLLFLFQPTEQTPNNPKFDQPPFDLTAFRYESISEAAEIPGKLIPHLRTIWQEAMNG